MTETQPVSDSDKAIHGIALCQFLLGTIIVALNVLALGATFINRKLRSGSFYFLSSNLWFANVLLGGIVAVSNVVDRPKYIALEKVEGTVAVMNCLATLATLLALSTARLVSVRTPDRRMANRTVLKILIFTWGGVFSLILIKTIVFSLNNMNPDDACYNCLLGFEAALLVFFGSAAVILYILAMYSVCVHQKTAIHDSAAAVPGQNGDFAKEYHDTITVGIWLGTFTLPFFMLVVLFAVHVIGPDNGVDRVAAEVILTLFYTHCVVNPLVLICRDDEVRATAQKLITCQRFVNDPAGQDQGREAGALQPAGQPITPAYPAAPPAYSSLPPINPTPSAQENHSSNNTGVQSQGDGVPSAPGQPQEVSVPNGITTFHEQETSGVSDPRGGDLTPSPKFNEFNGENGEDDEREDGTSQLPVFHK